MKKIEIQLFSNSLGEEELRAIKPVFESKWIGFGNEARLFEKELGERIGSSRLLTVNSCTSALFMSMKVLGIASGDEVIIPSVNFIGAANAVLEVGAKPVFADVDLRYLNIIPEEIGRLRNKNTKAVILLHYGGHPCDMEKIRKFTEGIYIIEDSANSILSKYKGVNCGTLGDIGCFSFDAMKILSVGDGGAISVKDEKLFEKAQQLRYLGIKDRQSGIDALKEKTQRWWEVELYHSSGRYITNDILSAIGRIQLRKIGGFIKRRKEIWHIYQNALSGLDWLELPPEPLPETESSYYLYWLKAKERDRFARHLIENGIYCTFRYYPLHLIRYYDHKERLAKSELLNDTTLNIPIHQNLSDSDIKTVIETIKGFKC
jgi:aminotransferase